ncbi:AzlD domain-containing protein [Roseovarius faecimaris]|uniref:AzlD domain-containing protein n=1 Tax=Roseovarius faecimaris TaxID=2494550 RepID=A0A6I6IJB1_9RHOB|nr:AzlD domain-containing protein [Roseovarius faecimaris]QGX96919.1 AzlD domain-containing protein [Roseovarius faecimaris]
MIETSTLWLVIVAVGLGSYLMRFLFIGLIADRELPAWLLRHLRYTGVAVLPALVAPLVLWPPATDGQFDPVRMTAACVTVGVGYLTRNVLLSILAGGVSFYVGLGLVG